MFTLFRLAYVAVVEANKKGGKTEMLAKKLENVFFCMGPNHNALLCYYKGYTLNNPSHL